MPKIEADLPLTVLNALAKGCGFRITYDHSPGADEWTLSAGHGATHVQYVGTRRDICAFLSGYAAMRIQTTQILNEIDNETRKLIVDMRTRLGH